MKYHQLPLASKKSRKRVGRGIGSGRGKTAGRGTKGQRARSGVSLRPGFEGGQNPLTQRLPKLRGSGMDKRHRKPKSAIIFTDQLDSLGATKTVTPELLAEKGLASKTAVRIKLLKRGDIKKSVKLEVHAASDSAREAVKKAGGSVKLLPDKTKKQPTKAKSDKKS